MSKLFEDFKIPWYERYIWWRLCWLLDDIVEHCYYKPKHFIQRGKRGYSYRDIWNMDSYLSKLLPDMLEHLATTSNSYPIEMSSKEWTKMLKKWAKDIREASIDPPLKVTDKGIEKYKKQVDANQKLIKDTFTEIGEHYFNLWD